MQTAYTPPEAARLLRVRATTLSQWRWQGRGPRYRKVGGRVLYLRSDLEEYLERAARTSTSTSDPGPGDGALAN